MSEPISKEQIEEKIDTIEAIARALREQASILGGDFNGLELPFKMERTIEILALKALDEIKKFRDKFNALALANGDIMQPRPPHEPSSNWSTQHLADADTGPVPPKSPANWADDWANRFAQWDKRRPPAPR